MQSVLIAKAKEMALDNIAGHKLPWIETLTITSSNPIELPADKINDDLTRELAFYQQALAAGQEAKKRIIQAKVPFNRPSDFFAEMIKSDQHMLRIKKHLVEEAQAIKSAEEAKKMREMRKFGKKVQIEKIQERQKLKADTLEKINSLKRKRRDQDGGGVGMADDDDEFEIELERAQTKEKSNNHGKNKKRIGKVRVCCVIIE